MRTYTNFRIIVIAMVLLSFPILMTSCFRVGDDDPFVSIYSRKARVVGKWEVSEINSTIRKVDGSNVSTITTTKVTPDRKWTQNIKIENTDSVKTFVGKVVENRNIVDFENNGAYKEIFEYEYGYDSTLQNSENIIKVLIKVINETSGSWNFINGIEQNYQNKERISIIVEEKKTTTVVTHQLISDEQEQPAPPSVVSSKSVSRNYANGEMSYMWKLIMLRKSKIIMQQDVKNYTLSVVGGNRESVYQEIGVKSQTLTSRVK